MSKKNPLNFLFLISITTILLLNITVWTTTGEEDYTPLFGINTDYGLVSNYYPNCFADFVYACHNKGFSAIMYFILDSHLISKGGDGSVDYYFLSPTLQSLGYTFKEDHLSQLVEEAKKYDIDVFVDLQELAYIVDNPSDYSVPPPSIEDLKNIVYELADEYEITGVSEEMFKAEWFEPVYQACQDKGLTYIHKAIHWDFGAMGQYWNHTVFEVYPNCHIIMTEDYDKELDPPHIVASEQFPSIAKYLNKEYHIKVCPAAWALKSIPNMENVMLLKAIQFKPRYIYVMTWNKEYVDTSDFTEMTNLIKEYALEEEKPICNIVLHLTGDEPPDTWDWWEFPSTLAAVSTGIKASGYDIITTPTPIDNADMYYIFTRGAHENWSTPIDIDTILPLFDTEKPIFFQVAYVLPYTTADWQTLRSKFGIDTEAVFNILKNDTGSILYGTYKGIEYPHLRKKAENEIYINSITPEDVTTGEVLSTGIFKGTTYALIIKKGNNYFINGSNLDLRASFPISNLINDGLQKPTACVVTAGNTSIFYALDTTENQTELHIKLPNALTNQISWFKRDINGVTSSGTSSYDPKKGYKDTLKEGTLLIIKTLPDYVYGKVTDTDGVGLKDVKIEAIKAQTEQWVFLDTTPQSVTKTNKDGTYIIYGLIGTYSIRASKEGWRTQTKENIMPGDEVNFTLLPSKFKTYIYPNPFRMDEADHCIIKFHLPETSYVSIRIYNLTGELTRELIDGEYPAGTHRIKWDGKNDSGKRVASSTYFYIIKTKENREVKKIAVIK